MTTKKTTASLSTVDPAKKLLSDSSSLVDLKAEVFRKHQEAKFNKLHGKSAPTFAHANAKDRGEQIWSKKNAGLTTREKRDLQERSEEELRVREALDRKAKLYDELKNGGGASDDRFLVQFNHNREDDDDDGGDGHYPEADPGEAWVEYTDSLGRTRTCMKKDLDWIKRQDRELSQAADERSAQGPSQIPNEPDLLSEDMRRELLRQKWEKEEEQNLTKRNVHYQDVLFDEARTHGAGFYRFSKDESTRHDQQEELNQLHKETEQARASADQEKAKRRNALKARLKKVRDKKRLRMGLPVLESDSDDNDGDADDMKQEEKEKSLEEDVMENLKQLRKEKEEREREAKRRLTVREWDVGKDGVSASSASASLAQSYGMKGEKKILDQSEWVSERRRDRAHEFAPPTNYEPTAKSRKIKTQPHTTASLDSAYGRRSSKSSASSRSTSTTSSAPFAVPPPPTPPHFSTPPPGYQHPPPGFDTPPPKPKVDPMSALDESAKEIEPTEEEEPNPPGETLDQVSIGERLKMFRDSSDHVGAPAVIASTSQQVDARGRGAEFAPPTSMDYYTSSSSKKKSDGGFRSRAAMEDSFKFGIASKKPTEGKVTARHYAFEECDSGSDED